MSKTNGAGETSIEFLSFTKMPIRFNVVKFNGEERNIYSAVYIDPNNVKKVDEPFYNHFIEKNKESNAAIIDKILQNLQVNYQIPDDCSIKFQKPEYLGYTLLHFAIRSGSINDIRYLLDRGADFTLKSSDGLTPLRLAVTWSFGTDCRDCFHLKGTLKHPKADAILDAHVKTNNSSNPRCKDGISHLHIACITNHTEAVKLFLKSGTDVNERVNSNSMSLPGYSPLHVAARYCSVETIKLLLAHESDKNAKNGKGMTPLHILIRFKMEIIQIIRVKSYSEDSLLHVDLKKVNDAIDLLTSDVSDYLHPIDDTGLTKFHLTCITTDSLDESNLPDRNMNVAISFDSPVWPGYTPLHIAAHHSIDNFISLANNGANLAAKDVYDITPLYTCLKHQHSEDVFRMFSSCDVLKGIRFTDGTTLIDLMSGLLTGSTFLSILDSIKDVNMQIAMDSAVWPGYTLLHLAVVLASKIDRSWFWDFHSYLDYIEALISYKKSTEEKINDHISSGFYEILDALLKSDADVTITDASGVTPLHLAYYLQDEKVLKMILKHRHENLINLVSPQNLSHFHIALYAGHIQSVKRFLTSGVNVNSHVQYDYKFIKINKRSEDNFVSLNSGLTPLQISIFMDNVEMTKLLLNYGADPLMKNLDGLTPLLYAFLRLEKEQINLLLSDHRVIQENTTFNGGMSNFHAACYANNLEVIQYYLDLGVDINCRLIYEGAERFKSFKRFASYTPLHIAVESEYVELVQLLLKNGAKVNEKNAKGLTPLNVIINMIFSRTWIDGNSFPEEMKIILDCLFSKLSSENDAEFKDDIGLTLLHVACARLDVEAVKKLLDSGADVNAQISEKSPIFPGFTAFHFIVCLRNTYENIMSIAQLLLERGADVTLQNSENQTPIHIAYDNKYEGPIMDVLLQNQRDYQVNPTNNNGISHFHIACSRTDAAVVEKFIQNGADVNKRTYYYSNHEYLWSPLYFAVTRERKEVFDLLMKCGADTKVRDRNGTSLLLAAVRAPNSDDALYIMKTLIRLNPEDVDLTNDQHYNPLYSLTLSIRNKMCAGDNEGKLTPRDFEAVELLMSSGARINIYKRHDGFLGRIFRFIYNFYPEIFMKIISTAMDLTSIDPDTGGSALHNLLTMTIDRYVRIPDENAFADVTGELLQRGCKLDLQDFAGYTPLHTATLHSVEPGVAGLLMQGADVNIADKKGKTALEYLDKGGTVRLRMRIELIWHMYKMMLVNVYVNDNNKSMCDKLYQKAKEEFKEGWTEESCFEELERMKNIRIFNELSLRRILSEAFVVEYSTMGQLKRDTINSFFNNNKMLHKDYVHFAGLLRLQHRKAIMRLELIEPAKTTLHFLTGYAFPDCCIEIIMQFLSCDDLKVLKTFDKLNSVNLK